MAKVGEHNVISGRAIVIWDGINKPETKDNGKIVHSLKVAMLPSDPSFNEIDVVAKFALAAHPKLKGVIPPGGYNWHMATDPAKFDGVLAGYKAFNCKTTRGFPPEVFDANNVKLDPMQYGPMLYPGAIVNVLVHCYAYDEVSKGVACGLDGIRIMDITAPRLNVESGGIDTAAAFGGALAAVALPVAHQMTPTAPGAYDACIAAGWTDALLIQHGHMLA